MTYLNLESILLHQLTLMRDLRSVMLAKRTALIKSELDQIAKLVKREKEVSEQLTVAEEERIIVFEALCHQLTPNMESPTLAEFLEVAQPSDAPRLTQMLNEMRAIAHEVSDINLDNSLLTQNLIEYTDLVLKLFKYGSTSPNYSYKRGAVEPDSEMRRGLIDAKA